MDKPTRENFRIQVKGPFELYIWVGTDIVARVEGKSKLGLEANLLAVLNDLIETYQVVEIATKNI